MSKPECSEEMIRMLKESKENLAEFKREYVGSFIKTEEVESQIKEFEENKKHFKDFIIDGEPIKLLGVLPFQR